MTHLIRAGSRLSLSVVFPVPQKYLIASSTCARLGWGSSVGGPGFHSFASLLVVLITAGESFEFSGGIYVLYFNHTILFK